MDRQDIIILLIIVAAGIVTVTSLVLFLKNCKKEKSIELSQLLDIFDPKNIIKIEFRRNKIIIQLEDVNKFDAKKLYEYGAKGINIIGNKVKFYFDGSNEKNEEIYKKIKKTIEG
ncbi:MAG: hypothetical protein K9L74_04505 [Candidatus Izimaplasma sp.]|nr:hypothetical protein [Candidatus Izimaplasma bacterium]